MEGLIATLTDSQFGGLYKNNDKTKESAQGKRRQEALERITTKRQDEIDRNRSIYNIDDLIDDFDDDTESMVSDCSSTIPGYKKSEAYKRQQRRKKFHPRMVGQLMKNDWILERPEDVEDWMFLPCPKGTQGLLIAVNGHTRLYSNKGYCRLNCGTALPAGNRSNTSSNPTILDVIVCWKTNTIFALDLLKWKGYEYYDSPADFRQQWKEMKIAEMNSQKRFKFKIRSLTAFSTEEEESAKARYDTCDFDLDGILCYHKHGVYYPSGIEEETYPLYGWTKQDKMQSILGVHCEFVNADNKENVSVEIDEDKPPLTPPDTSGSSESMN